MDAPTARRVRIVPPGPRGYPILGAFPKARANPLEFFLDTARRHGDVVSMRFGTRRLYLLSHPDDIKHVLQDHHQAYGKSAPAARVRPLFGDSLTMVDGEPWRRQRRMMRPIFHPKALSFLIPVITGATAETLERWEPIAARGECADVLGEMTRLTRTIIMRGLFGDIDLVSARAVGEALELALAHADRSLWSALGWLDVPLGGRRRFVHAVRTVDDFVADMVERGRRGRISGDALVSVLLEARDATSGQPMHERDLRDELKALLVAGHTTTTSALAWTWYVLSEHPAVWGRLRSELQILPPWRALGAEDLAALQYTRMVIDEVLRLYPPTWLTARTPLLDEEIRGYRIPAGSIVLLSPFVTHRHPEFWEEPHRFDPERFTAARSENRPRFAYFPFGGGPRSCIGSWLASTMMQLVIGTVARRFQPVVVPAARVAMNPGLTLRPDPGVPVTLRRC